MHELAHILLGHDPARVDVAEDGSLVLFTYDKDQEDEANWLAACLLLPRAALLVIRKESGDLKSAAKDYGVSQVMLQYRLNVTGVEHQMRRTVRSVVHRGPAMRPKATGD
jgi:Zn-dependent peptidase ImmA (M78 family)